MRFSPPGALVVLLLALAWGACSATSTAAPPTDKAVDEATHAVTLTVEVTGLRSTEGQLGVSIFRSAVGFPDQRDDAALARLVQVSDTSMTVVFEDVPTGEIAVAVIHDEDGDGELDTNLLGIPVEGYGVSRNPPPRMGPPLWEASRFDISDDATTRIELVY